MIPFVLPRNEIYFIHINKDTSQKLYIFSNDMHNKTELYHNGTDNYPSSPVPLWYR